MRVCYVAAPFSAKTHWEVLQNIMAAKKLALEVAWLGAMPMCPHGNTESFHGTLTEEFWYKGTMELLKRCDAIVMHHGWELSKGCAMEHAHAVETGMRIFYHDKDTGLKYTGLKDWAEEE